MIDVRVIIFSLDNRTEVRCFEILIIFFDALRVLPAETRLTVYRRLRVRGSHPSMPGRLRTYSEIWADFLKKLSFYTISIHFLDFLYLKVINTDPHAQGFAPL